LHCLSNQGVDEVRLRKAHFGLMWVHVDIDILRRKRQEHEYHRVAFFRQDMTISLRERVQEDPIPDDATVHKQVLRVACGTAPRRRGDEPREEESPFMLFDGD
jgi:hypothetical protein